MNKGSRTFPRSSCNLCIKRFQSISLRQEHHPSAAHAARMESPWVDSTQSLSSCSNLVNISLEPWHALTVAKGHVIRQSAAFFTQITWWSRLWFQAILPISASSQFRLSSQVKQKQQHLKQNEAKDLCSLPSPYGTAETENQLSQKLVRPWTPRALQPSPQSLLWPKCWGWATQTYESQWWSSSK